MCLRVCCSFSSLLSSLKCSYSKMKALIVQQSDATQCRSITPTVGTISKDIPQKRSPYPYIADTMAAFAPGMFLISGFSLRRRGIDELISVKGPPKMSPHVRIRVVTEVSLGYKCTSSKKTKRMADASRQAMNMVLLKVGLKYDPSSPPKKVLMAQRTAMMRDSRCMPIIDRQKMSHATTTALTDLTKRKLRMQPGTLGNFHTVIKLTAFCLSVLFVSCMSVVLRGGSLYSTNASGACSIGDSGGTSFLAAESSGRKWWLRRCMPTKRRATVIKKMPGFSLASSTKRQLIINAMKSPNCELPVHNEKANPFQKCFERI